MKYLIPVLVGAATINVAVTTALAQANGAFNERVPLTPYLYGYGAALILLMIAGIVAMQAAKQEKSLPPPSIHQTNEQTVKQEVNPQQNVYIGQEFLHQLKESPKSKVSQRKPNLSMCAHQYPRVKRDADGIWRECWDNEANPIAFLLSFRNDPYPDNTGEPALAVRAHVWWEYNNGIPGTDLSPACWIDEECGAVDIPVGVSKRLLIATRFTDQLWYGWMNPKTVPGGQSQTRACSNLPTSGKMHLRLIGCTDEVWCEMHFDWKCPFDPNFAHLPEITQVSSLPPKTAPQPDKPPARPDPNLRLCQIGSQNLYRIGDEFCARVSQGMENSFPRFRGIVAEIMNASKPDASVGPAKNIKAELVIQVDGQEEILGPLAWTDTNSNTVSIEMGNPASVLLAVYNVSKSPTVFSEWRVPVNLRSRPDVLPGANKIELKQLERRGEVNIYLRIIQPESGKTLRTFTGTCRWRKKDQDPDFTFS
jgi:hypothetical protein